jgi:hypothetical protein
MFDSPERLPASVTLEERSRFRARFFGQRLIVEPEPFQTPDPILRNG